jgi:hypothetical protein
MKHLLLTVSIAFFLSASVSSQTETTFLPLKTNTKDMSGNHNYGRLKGDAYVDNGLHTGYNVADELVLPIDVMNGLMHYDIQFDVNFDSLNTAGALARNMVLQGNYECGDGRVDVFYNEAGQHPKSWIVILEGVSYTFHDRTLLAGEWDHLEIVKRRDSVKMYRNARLLGTYFDKSTAINILTMQLAQATACDGSTLNECMDGTLKNFKIINYDKPADSLTNALQQISVTSNTSTLNIYPNPSNGVIAVSFDKMTMNSNQTVAVKVFNNFGQLVKEISSPLNKNPVQLDLSNMPAGIYFIRTESGNIASTGKVVIK